MKHSPIFNLSTVNPFYPSKHRRTRSGGTKHVSRYARLPRSPVNASPVPRLTSLYHFDEAGGYGDRSYPGNCGGELIRDLLLYFRPRNVFDPMTGSGTCPDVCRELNVPCVSGDIRQGFDASDPVAFRKQAANAKFDFVWAHPPYWRQKLYTEDRNDLSRSPTLEAFLERYASFLGNCAETLSEHGKLAILMGDYSERDFGYVPLTYHTKRIAFTVGLRQHCTDIIRFSHGASSSRKTYRSSFIPGLHDVCIVFEKERLNRE